MKRSAYPYHQGFTLLETLIIMLALIVSMVMGAVLMTATMKADRTVRAALNRVAARKELATQFRNDVSHSKARPPKAGDFVAGASCLILDRESGERIIYQWREAALERIEQAGGKESRRRMLVGSPGTTLEFVPNDPSSGVVALRLTEPQGKGAAQHTELLAALGGDLK